jgi:hypothetical protein
MRWALILAAIALLILWAVARFMLAVTSAMIHVVLAVAIVLFVIGLIRAAMRRSSAP